MAELWRRFVLGGCSLAAMLLIAAHASPARSDEPGAGEPDGHWLHRHHTKVPACVECNPVTKTDKKTTTSYESRANVVCYPKATCHCLRCRFHFHGHHDDCDPVIVPVVKRVLVKHTKTEESRTASYEGKLSPSPPTVEPFPAPGCAVHGLGCFGHH